MNAEAPLVRDSPDPCEWFSVSWNPHLVGRPALECDPWHAEATVLVGARGQWRLCAACARRPEFKKFKARKEIRKR